MRKYLSTSSKLIVVIGSSTTLAQSLSLKISEGDTIFYGRSNPYNLKNWHALPDISKLGDAESYSRKVINDIKAIFKNTKYESVSLIILCGVSSTDWEVSLAVNQYMPALLATQFAELALIRSFQDLSITLMGSAASYVGGKASYASTKASLTGLMHSVNQRSAHCVRVNLVVPGAFEGNMINDWNNEKRAKVSARTTINRIASADEIADAIIFVSNNGYVADSIINMSAGQINIE